ncbi:MAG TPA: glycosyltransferase family protein [Phenylobacterium sp.]|uniref:glycosyltransferase family protein n=1 Tax=Phenylobacterium sp. TaxID=1871053 RepID=UPI002C3F73CC|nr:glycosyltransferase family protein [Phenylobacterium sp.]HXA38717.1 glycosyltransferase family protein [Phenylobacterium sp.]
MNLAILQARMTSSRLPGKVMAPVLGEPMIGRQVERLRRARRIDKLMVATSTDPSDDPLAAYCEGLGLEVFRGALEDVLDRYRAALARHPAASAVVRLTADCPLTDPDLIDQVIQHHIDVGADYTSNTLGTRTYPHGLDTEVIKPGALLEAAERARDPYEREHVTPYVYRRPETYRLAGVARHESLAALRWTVDVPPDLAFVREVYAKLYPFDPAFGADAVVALPVNSSAIPA